VTLLEATEIAGGSSGKAGGLVAEWATPKCLAPLSFQQHAELAKLHGGDKLWGHRFVYCAEVELEAHDLDRADEPGKKESASYPSGLNWLAPGVLKSYEEIGKPKNSAQVNPYMYTTAMARLAEEKGARVIIGNATRINYSSDGKAVESVDYVQDGEKEQLSATDIIVAAGPWTPRVLAEVTLLTPRGHSVVVKPTKDMSPYVLFPTITAAEDSGLDGVISPELYPRPGDAMYDFDTVYTSSPDDYEVDLPSGTGDVLVDEQKCEDVWTAVKSVSQEIHDGEILRRQACYKPQIREHEDGEEVGPMVGPMDVRGLWLATGHDEWGMSNAPGTGLIMSEMVFEGRAHSTDAQSLDPKHLLKPPKGVEQRGWDQGLLNGERG